jgi:hypothetical protein
MTTTIQIDDDTKRKLFQIKLKLEKEKGSSISYNELIKILLKDQSAPMSKRENLREFRKLRGVLPKSTLTQYLVEHEEERKKEERWVPFTNAKE